MDTKQQNGRLLLASIFKELDDDDYLKKGNWLAKEFLANLINDVNIPVAIKPIQMARAQKIFISEHELSKLHNLTCEESNCDVYFLTGHCQEGKRILQRQILLYQSEILDMNVELPFKLFVEDDEDLVDTLLISLKRGAIGLFEEFALHCDADVILEMLLEAEVGHKLLEVLLRYHKILLQKELDSKLPLVWHQRLLNKLTAAQNSLPYSIGPLLNRIRSCLQL